MTIELRDGLAVDLQQDLHAFLALEAPFLIHRLPAAGTLSELESALLQAITEHCEPHPRFAGLEMFPGRTHAGEAVKTRDALLELARSFFARQRIKAGLTREERLTMLRAMLLARAVDTFLKDAFDKKSVKWRSSRRPRRASARPGRRRSSAPRCACDGRPNSLPERDTRATCWRR